MSSIYKHDAPVRGKSLEEKTFSFFRQRTTFAWPSRHQNGDMIKLTFVVWAMCVFAAALSSPLDKASLFHEPV